MRGFRGLRETPMAVDLHAVMSVPPDLDSDTYEGGSTNAR